jgi:hypothetical protein
LDPESPDFGGYAITGTVERIYDGGPIADVEVSTRAAGRFALTDSNGTYAITGLQPGSHLIEARAPGFAPESTEVVLDSPDGVESDFVLDALPSLSGSRLTTYVINRNFPEEDNLYARARTVIDEPDGLLDVDSIFVTVQETRFLLEFADSEHVATLEESDLPGQNLEILLECPARFEVVDQSGHRDVDSLVYASRIIRNYATPFSPTNWEIVGATPILKWRSAFWSFEVTFTVQVYGIEVGYPEVLEYELSGISGDSLSLALEDPLDNGLYYWVVWTVDELENSARSAPAMFEVLDE